MLIKIWFIDNIDLKIKNKDKHICNTLEFL